MVVSVANEVLCCSGMICHVEGCATSPVGRSGSCIGGAWRGVGVVGSGDWSVVDAP